MGEVGESNTECGCEPSGGKSELFRGGQIVTAIETIQKVCGKGGDRSRRTMGRTCTSQEHADLRSENRSLYKVAESRRGLSHAVQSRIPFLEIEDNPQTPPEYLSFRN